LHACENIRALAVSIGIEDSDGDNLGLAGNTKAGSSSDTSNMSAMSILISIGRTEDVVSAKCGAAFKFLENG
jgi:hypothetical protein